MARSPAKSLPSRKRPSPAPVPKLSRRITVSLVREGDGYVAQAIEVDVVSQGDTLDEALANIQEALELYFEDAPDLPSIAPLITSVEVHTARS